MDHVFPHSGISMAVPPAISCRLCDLVLIRAHPFAFPCVGRLITVPTTRGLRWIDTKCPHGTSGCKHVCDVHSCVTSWSGNYTHNPGPAHTITCRLGCMALADVALCPIVRFRRGSWIVSRVVLPCGPGCQTTMSHGSTHGLIRAHTRWHPDLSTCIVAFRSGTTGSLRSSSLGCLCANLLVVSTDPTVHGRKASLARLPSPRVGTA